MRQRMFQITRNTQENDFPSQIYDLFIVIISCLSIIPLVFRSTYLFTGFYGALSFLELATVYVIFFDYILGWMTSDYLFEEKGWKSFARYPFSLPAIIEILSILPSLGVVPSWLRILRLFMVIRLIRYSRPLVIVTNVIRCQKKPLLSVSYIVLVYAFASALFMFLSEPALFDNFYEAMYWSLTAVTTVTYGDVIPTTDLGKFVAMISAIMGVAVVALPSGIVTAGFMEQLELARKQGEKYYEHTVSLELLRKRFVSAISFRNKGSLKGYFARVGRYWATHKKFRLYLITILVCVLVNESFYMLASMLGLTFWLDMTGTAIAAVLLEPAAGIIVGFVNNLIISIHQGDEATILFFAESALTAIGFGFYFHISKVGSAKNVIKFAFVVIVCEALVDLFLHFLFSDAVVCQPWEIELNNWCMSVGCSYFTATAVECLVSKTLDIIAVSMIAATGVSLVRDSRFDPKVIFAHREEAKSKDAKSMTDSSCQDATNLVTPLLNQDAYVQDDGLLFSRSINEMSEKPQSTSGKAETTDATNQMGQLDITQGPSQGFADALPSGFDAQELSDLILLWAQKKRDLAEGRISLEEFELWKSSFIQKP